MRAFANFCLLSLLACRPAEYSLIDESSWQKPLHCPALPALLEGAPVSDVAHHGDSAFIAVFPAERRVALFGADLQPRTVWTFDADGPRGLRAPTSASIFDATLYVADEGRGTIRAFDLAGEPLSTLQLGFAPRRVRTAGGRVFVTPLVAGPQQSRLLYVLANGRAEPVDVPAAQYDEAGIMTMANLVSLVPTQDRLLVLPELVVPFGYVVSTAPRAKVERRFPIPVPQSEAARVDRLPSQPLSERNVNELTVAAFTSTRSDALDAVLYVTRLGDGKRRPFRKLLVELDSSLALRRVFPIDVNPHHMTYVAARSSVVGANSDSEWFECKLP